MTFFPRHFGDISQPCPDVIYLDLWHVGQKQTIMATVTAYKQTFKPKRNPVKSKMSFIIKLRACDSNIQRQLGLPHKFQCQIFVSRNFQGARLCKKYNTSKKLANRIRGFDCPEPYQEPQFHATDSDRQRDRPQNTGMTCVADFRIARQPSGCD